MVGGWNVTATHHSKDSVSYKETNFSASFQQLNKDVLLCQLDSRRGSERFFKLHFVQSGVFQLIDDDSNEKIAEFEFFSTLFPHLTATGRFKSDGIYNAEFISQHTMQLSVFNKTTLSSDYYMFSKALVHQSYLERKLPLLLSASLIIIKIAIKEYQKGRIASRQRQQMEEENRKYDDDNELRKLEATFAKDE